jgi:HNH endonuclease
MRHRHQSVLPLAADAPPDSILIGPNSFRPGLVPYQYQPDPRETPEWRRIRKRVLARDHSACRKCGRPASDVDHRVELMDGGAPYDPENLQALCADCHGAKSSESRYRRARRATTSWGRMTLCPKCSGTGICVTCLVHVHACTTCLGVRIVPERCAESGTIPSQSMIAEVSSLAWAGVQPPPP